MNTITRTLIASLGLLLFCSSAFSRNGGISKETKTNNNEKAGPCSLIATISGTTPVLCNGGSSGSATANPSGGTLPYTYSWAPSGGNAVKASNLSAGTYTVTVTDAASCTATATATISQPSKLVLLSLSNDTVCTGACTGTFSPSLSGGTPLYIYAWSNGITTATETGLCAGSYTLNAADANGCTVSASASVTSSVNIPSLVVTPTITNATCIGTLDGSISLLATAPSSPFRYEWQSSNFSNTIYGNNTLNNLYVGTYSVTIFDKFNNCNVLSYPVSNLYSCNGINGKTYNDTNFTCAYSSKDPGLNNSYITITPGSYVVFPDVNGNFSQYNLPYGSYTVTQTIYTGSPFVACSSSQAATVNASSPTVYFSDTTHAPISDPMISYFYSTPILVGDSCSAQFQIKNNGSVASNGRAFFTVGDSLKLISTTPAYSSYSHDTIYWNYTGLLPSATLNYSVHCTADTTVFTGWSDCSLAGVQPSNPESNSQNDQMYSCEFFGVPCDPNSKAVNPAGVGANGYIYPSDSVLTYVIRFQNVGSAMAQNIFIVDTISSHLDINTLQVLGASNTFSYTVTGNRVKFIFNGIHLPDSAANPDGSKGWIQYQIHQNKANIGGDVINNTAFIYFDYNPAVVTNTTVNTLYNLTGIPAINQEQDLKIYPNPATDDINLSYTLNKSANVNINVIDLLGRIVYTNAVGTKLAGKQQDVISVKSLSSGSYILRLQTDNSVLNKKLVIIR